MMIDTISNFGQAPENKKIKGILFDSGRVLNGPVTGHWFITNNFFEYVDKHKFNSIPSREKELAFKKAGEFINAKDFVLTEEEEYKYFFEYYSIFAKYLPQLQLTKATIELIAKDYVYNYDKYSFFEDAKNIIPKLSYKYKLAVVSDAWPSLENVFKKAGLRNYFASFVISSKLGVRKPNELMYKTALEELGLCPEEAIFIDDSAKNCSGASSLGIKAFLLCRDWKLYLYHKIFHRSINVIRSLTQLSRLL